MSTKGLRSITALIATHAAACLTSAAVPVTNAGISDPTYTAASVPSAAASAIATVSC
jgi:hypothetical protein